MFMRETLTIDLRKVLAAPLSLQQTLGDDYFAALEQEEILGGRVEVEVKVKATTTDTFDISLRAKGEATVACDRCLEPLSLPVEAKAQFTLRCTESEADTDDTDVIAIPFTATTYDLSWDIYETIALALPLQRVHAEGGCNEEVTRYIL